MIPPIQTKRLKLVPQTLEEILATLASLTPEQKKEVSPEWLPQVEKAMAVNWPLSFSILRLQDNVPLGQSAFKAPPDPEGVVEIAYGIHPEHQNQGYASEAADALTAFALNDPRVNIVRAHTLPQKNASTNVLTKCGFQHLGEVIDPEDGRVWRWEKLKT